MYGTRDSAQNWQNNCSEAIHVMGFELDKVSPCHIYHKIPGACGMVHIDDLVSVVYSQSSRV